ncbi:MAG: phospho-sugar mutase, partial [Alphaproteobacteria bacterium]|nr:phospho-sugar mutase [Alphaproteobacteria bacterium]
NFDQETKHELQTLIDNNSKQLEDSFYRSLEFGTSGLRGEMGVGTNRINKYTIGWATQGFANYLKKYFTNQDIKVVIGHDSRNKSRFFAETTAAVFSANGIKVYLFDALRPTPEISFTILKLNCQAGVICTASHNPKEYNGYKAYFNNGACLVPPHDQNVLHEIQKLSSVDDINWNENKNLIELIGEDLDKDFINMVQNQIVYPEVIKKQQDLKIVYTPIHGSGIMLVPSTLQKIGFTNVHILEAQAQPDGNFPTVIYPNPEEKETMSLGLQKAQELDADIVLGTDPDADRVGIGLKNHKQEWVLMNGNQTAVLAFSYLIEARKAKQIAQPNDFIVKTIVTTDMLDVIAEKNNLICYNVLTGFKWIAEKINALIGKENFIIGGEESFGLMIGDKLRDKDAVTAVAILCEMTAYYKNKGLSPYQQLISLYCKYGFFLEDLISITIKGLDGNQKISNMMANYRSTPPQSLDGETIVTLLDYELQIETDLITKIQKPIQLPKSNVLQFITDKGSKVSVRPSGTEPKIKFYFSVQTSLNIAQEYDEKLHFLKRKIKTFIQELNLS